MKLKAPNDLKLDHWWDFANCKGMKVKAVKAAVCASCVVRRECLWTAMTEDDRVDHDAMFVRAGLTGYMRDKHWYMPKHRSNRLAAFEEAWSVAERMRESIVSKETSSDK